MFRAGTSRNIVFRIDSFGLSLDLEDCRHRHPCLYCIFVLGCQCLRKTAATASLDIFWLSLDLEDCLHRHRQPPLFKENFGVRLSASQENSRLRQP